MLGEFVALLDRHGFTAIEIEDLSWRVLPSVLHVPLVSAGFYWREGLRELEPRRRGTVRASLGAFACALLAPRRVGYYLIRARRES